MYDVTLCSGLLDLGDGGSLLLHRIGNCLSFHTVIYKSPASPLQETEILCSEFFFSTYIPCILIFSKFFYAPVDAQVYCLKNSFKIYSKINIKTAPTCFGAVTPSSGSALLMLAKVTVSVQSHHHQGAHY